MKYQHNPYKRLPSFLLRKPLLGPFVGKSSTTISHRGCEDIDQCVIGKARNKFAIDTFGLIEYVWREQMYHDLSRKSRIDIIYDAVTQPALKLQHRAVSFQRCPFSHESSQNTPHSSPVKAMYGASFLD